VLIGTISRPLLEFSKDILQKPTNLHFNTMLTHYCETLHRTWPDLTPNQIKITEKKLSENKKQN
jgi:hypothetical protein